MKLYFKTSVSFLVLLALLASCREEFETEPYTYTQLLTGTKSKVWRMTGISILEDGQSTQNIPLPDTDCVFDDRYVFYANEEKRYEVLNGRLKCDESEGDVVVSDTWSFSNANATLEFVMPLLAANVRLPFIVRSLNESRFTAEIFFEGGSYRFVFQAIQTEN